MNRVAGLVLAGVVLLLGVTPTSAQAAMCPSAGQPSVPCDASGNCFMSCCLSSGVCPTFSCASSLGAPSDAGTICASTCKQELQCRLFNLDCPSTDVVCIGTVSCLTVNCGGRLAGDVCLVRGPAVKVCSGLH